jgi:hypothetical protein
MALACGRPIKTKPDPSRPGGSARRLARIFEKRSGLAASDRQQRATRTPLMQRVNAWRVANALFVH